MPDASLYCPYNTVQKCRTPQETEGFFLLFLRNSYLQQRENMNTWQFILHTHGVLAKLNWVLSMTGKHNVTRKRAREVHLLQQFGVTVDLTCNLISCLVCTANLIFKLPLVDRNHGLYLWNNNKEVILVFNNKNYNNYNNSNYKLYEIKCDRMHFNSTLL